MEISIKLLKISWILRCAKISSEFLSVFHKDLQSFGEKVFQVS